VTRSEPRSRIREPPVHSATQAPPSHALRGATDEGVGIDHGGAPTLGAQQHQRPGARAQGRRPRHPLPPCPLPPQRRHPQAGAGAAGDSGLGTDGRGGEEFSLRLLGHLAGILPNPCSRVLHGLATVWLTFELSWQRRWGCQALAADNVQVTYGPGLVDRRWGSI